MRTALAEKLLIKVMNWSVDEVARERPLIQAMASFKYDEYQQFSTGIRFTESLAQWLNQFTPAERTYAYEFIKQRLIFISREQISHLVNICFSEKINPLLLRKVSLSTGIPGYHVKRLYESKEYKEVKRRSLFLGVSDGAKIDQLRRSSGISNEQVFSSYYISTEKKDDFLTELQNDGYEGKFNSIYLIDDFTGSGLSYARQEDGIQTGKIIKFLRLVYNLGSDITSMRQSTLHDLIDVNNLDFHILFYIARKESLEYIKTQICKWKEDNKLDFVFSVEAIQIIANEYTSMAESDSELIELSRKYIKPEIIDRHYKKGKHEQYYLGFDECSLPLILNHNTPNNSLPILWWYPEDESFRGLFPRITRHRE